jgi:molybdenum cofactor cytidylyltransferase
MSTRLHLAAIILAAGRARRMGTPKLLLPWHGSTIIAHEIETWRQLDADIRVVCGPRPDPIQDELDRLHFPDTSRFVNSDPDDGMFSSIRIAARAEWPEDTTHFAIVLGDQPQIKKTTLQKLLHIAEEEFDTIAQPSHHNHFGHPVILPRQQFLKLADTPAPRLCDFLSGEYVTAVPVDDPGLDININVAADYESALRVEQQSLAHH